MIKISVVIPTCCRPDLLRRCLSCLQHQSFLKNSYEVIVVSDGPDETTQKTVREFSVINKHFVFFQLVVKKGPAAARNFGWRHAKGILIAFTDDDTLPDVNWLTNIWKAYKGQREIAYTGRIKVPLPVSPTDYEKNTAGLELAEFVTANCCITRYALEKVEGFDERFSMAWREDSDLEFKLMQLKIPVVHLLNALVVHPVRKASWGVSLKEQKKGVFNALLYKKFPKLYRMKIQPSPLWDYYMTVTSALFIMISVVAGAASLAFVFFLLWIVLLVGFIDRRLRQTSKRRGHIAEMIVTSLFIPFVSVYWQLYGAWKYKVFFL